MTMQRRLAVLALAVAVTAAAAPAHADRIGAGSNGTGIKDWLVDVKSTPSGHGARGLCEYAVNADSGGLYGHFELGGDAWTGGPFDGSPDIVSVDVRCTFEGTATGTLVLADSSTTPVAVVSHDQALGRPSRLCLLATMKWTNGDVISMNKCQFGGRVSWHYEDVAVAVGVDDGTTEVVGGASGAAGACTGTTALAHCANAVTSYADRSATSATDDEPPGVNVTVDTGPDNG